MNDYPTVLGQDPSFSGVVGNKNLELAMSYVYEVVDKAKSESGPRYFSLIVRHERSSRGWRFPLLRWMVYVFPRNAVTVEQIEFELTSLNWRRDRAYPFVVVDVSSLSRQDSFFHRCGPSTLPTFIGKPIPHTEYFVI